MSEPFLGETRWISLNYPPKNWAFCNGQLLPINQNQALFSLLGMEASPASRIIPRGNSPRTTRRSVLNEAWA